LLSPDEAEKWIKEGRKRGDLDMVLYYVKGGSSPVLDHSEGDIVQVDSAKGQSGSEKLNVIDKEHSEVAGLAGNNAELQEVPNKFRNVFKNELPDGLPPRREVDYVIDTSAAIPVNQNTYPLSVQQL
jgi:hypothetical protein